MKSIQYLLGDATKPIKYPFIIAHICNDIGAWGSGFVVPLGKEFPKAKRDYLSLRERILGVTQFIQDKDSCIIANMIAQHGLRSYSNPEPIDYKALIRCLDQVREKALYYCLSVHMPRIGCGLAGGKWEQIEPIIRNTLCSYNIEVFVYDLKKD